MLRVLRSFSKTGSDWMRLVFSGMVRLGDGVRVSSSEMNGAIHIGNDDVIDWCR